MRLNQIRDFVTIVETGSVRAAARKLDVSQPAISKSLRSLEAELHLQLLQRSAKGVIPTPAGRAFFARAHVAHSELMKATQEAADNAGTGAGVLSFGVGPTAGFMIVPEAVARLRQEHPYAKLRIIGGYTHSLLPLVRDETLDFAIGTRPDTALDSSITFRPLFRHDFVVVGRKGHPLRKKRSLAQLTHADWISFHSWGSAGSPLARTFESAGLPMPANVIHCESYETALGMLARSDSLGIESRRMLGGSFARDYLEAIEVEESMPSYTAGVFRRADSPPTKVAATMLKLLTAGARRLGRSG
jgi:DNA-binding transcriptional LysR family regulator